MAANVARAGFTLTVHNRNPTPAEEFVVGHSAMAASTAAEAVEHSDFIITMLADGEALFEVYTGAGGVLETIRPGTVAIDMGTSGPDAVARVRKLVEDTGATLVDAPVSGSTPAAESGKLLIMVGASLGFYDQVRPLLESMGEPVQVGPPGSAATLKLVVNSILYGLNQALAEGVVLAERAGVDPATTIDVVARSAAGAPLVGYRRPQYLDPDGSPVMFTLDLAAKDLRLALDQAAALGVPMLQLQETLAVVERIIASGEGGRDMGFVVEAARRTIHQ
jgi:3-hydroxyisobutyrate dehydrogenase-like beta-hydroxyacid dehydrogenase